MSCGSSLPENRRRYKTIARLSRHGRCGRSLVSARRQVYGSLRSRRCRLTRSRSGGGVVSKAPGCSCTSGAVRTCTPSRPLSRVCAPSCSCTSDAALNLYVGRRNTSHVDGLGRSCTGIASHLAHARTPPAAIHLATPSSLTCTPSLPPELPLYIHCRAACACPPGCTCDGAEPACCACPPRAELHLCASLHVSAQRQSVRQLAGMRNELNLYAALSVCSCTPSLNLYAWQRQRRAGLRPLLDVCGMVG